MTAAAEVAGDTLAGARGETGDAVEDSESVMGVIWSRIKEGIVRIGCDGDSQSNGGEDERAHLDGGRGDWILCDWYVAPGVREEVRKKEVDRGVREEEIKGSPC